MNTVYIGGHLSVTNGYEAMKRIALHPALSDRPFILETPNDDEGYIREIHTVQRWLG